MFEYTFVHLDLSICYLNLIWFHDVGLEIYFLLSLSWITKYLNNLVVANKEGKFQLLIFLEYSWTFLLI